MSAVSGALVIAGALIAEEIVLGSKGGPSAVSGIFGGVANVVQRIADPHVPAIPNLADRKAK